MEKKELGLVGSVQLSTPGGNMRIQRGDMLRESKTVKVVKVTDVYRKYDTGEYFVECEDMDPGSQRVVRILPLGALSIMMG